jgi:hypothetical protein
MSGRDQSESLVAISRCAHSDALLAMKQAEAVVRVLVFAGYEIRRRAG